MIYFLYGANDFLIDKRVDELRKQFITQNDPNSIVTIDVNNVSSTDIMRQLVAISLFADKQLIIIKAFTANSENWTLLETNIDFIPSSTTVVLTDVAELSRVNNLSVTRTFKKLKASGATIEKYDQLKQWDIKPWLDGELVRRKLVMDGNAKNRLVELTAGDDNQQARLENELNKLVVLNKPITVDLINQYVEPSPVTNAFAILDTALTSQTNQAIELVRQLQNSGEDANRFLGLLASQELALVVAITGAEVKINPYQLNNAKKTAYKLGNHDKQLTILRHITEILAEVDEMIKQSDADNAWILIESAITKLSLLVK